MQRILVTMLTVGIAVGWGQNRGAAPNTLTPQEQKEGFELLFDGKTLDKFNLTPEMAKIWKAEDGVIKNDPAATGGTLLTKEDFANFVLKAEFRCHPDVNSGFILRQPRGGPAANRSARPGQHRPRGCRGATAGRWPRWHSVPTARRRPR